MKPLEPVANVRHHNESVSEQMSTKTHFAFIPHNDGLINDPALKKQVRQNAMHHVSRSKPRKPKTIPVSEWQLEIPESSPASCLRNIVELVDDQRLTLSCEKSIREKGQPALQWSGNQQSKKAKVRTGCITCKKAPLLF
jgi:hypothetical protein